MGPRVWGTRTRRPQGCMPLLLVRNHLSRGRDGKPGNQLPHPGLQHTRAPGTSGGAQKTDASCAPAVPPMPEARPGCRSRRTHRPEPSQPDRGAAAGAPRRHAKGPEHQVAGLATHAHSPLGTTPCSWLRWALTGAETLGRDLRAGRGLAAGLGRSLRGKPRGPSLADGRNGFITAWSADPAAPEASSGENKGPGDPRQRPGVRAGCLPT